jgi:hypothetical protein
LTCSRAVPVAESTNHSAEEPNALVVVAGPPVVVAVSEVDVVPSANPHPLAKSLIRSSTRTSRPVKKKSLEVQVTLKNYLSKRCHQPKTKCVLFRKGKINQLQKCFLFVCLIIMCKSFSLFFFPFILISSLKLHPPFPNNFPNEIRIILTHRRFPIVTQTRTPLSNHTF